MPAAGAIPAPLEAAEFAALMRRFEPFESAPHLAVAVSGGPDSLALLLLLDEWCAPRGGRLLALTVDHRLRPEAASEAAWVAGLCAGRGIAHRRLRWAGPAPTSGLQEAARTARYRLLAEACRSEGILHLALAHQLEDQGETFLLRLQSGSGPAGLAAMPAIGYLDEVRLLRPLLGQPRRRLEALLRRHGLPWIEDPSNQDSTFARTRLRSARYALTEAGLPAGRLAELAAAFGTLRAWSEVTVADLLAESCRLDPRGFAWLDRSTLLAAPRPLARQALGQLLRCLGGREQMPRGPKLDRLLTRLEKEPPPGATLAGCRILPRRGNRLLVVREPAAVGGPAGARWEGAFWDGRFRQLSYASSVAPPAPESPRVPPAARAGLPPSDALDCRAGLPHFTAMGPADCGPARTVGFAPRRPLTTGSFAVFR